MSPYQTSQLAVLDYNLTLRILGGVLGTINPQIFQCFGVICTNVAIAGATLQRIVGSCRVQFLQGGVALLSQQTGFISHGGDPLARLFGGRDPADQVQQLRNGFASAQAGIYHGRIQFRCNHAIENRVIVGIIDAGHQCAACQIIDLRVLVNELADVRVGADKHNLVSLDTDSLCDLIGIIDCNDTAIFKRNVQIRKIKFHESLPFKPCLLALQNHRSHKEFYKVSFIV